MTVIFDAPKGIGTYPSSSEPPAGATGGTRTAPSQATSNNTVMTGDTQRLELRGKMLPPDFGLGVPKTLVAGSAEQGHANPPSVADQAYASAMKKYEAALEKYESALAAHNGANAQNVSIDAANAPLEKEAAFWDEARAALLKVASHSLAGDSYISKKELTDLLGSTDPLQRSAADFLIANWDKIPVNKYPDWGGGMNADEMRQGAVAAGAHATAKRNLKQAHVNVPPHPGAPPTPPSPPGQSPETSRSAATGAPGAQGGTTTPSTPPATTPPKTPEQANAEMFPSFSQLPSFSSAAPTGEGRMLDATVHLQKSLDALEQDLAAAAAKGDQASMTAINNKVAKFQAGMSALMQMMKQRQEMESNMSKMFSEMAMSSIRNMR